MKLKLIYPILAATMLSVLLFTCAKIDESEYQTKELESTVSDPPLVSDATITTSAITSNSATLSWKAASDDQTPADLLTYQVFQSSSNILDTVQHTQDKGTAINSAATGLTSFELTGLSPGSTTYFNLVVSDQDNNSSVYQATSVTTIVPTISNGDLTASSIGSSSLTLSWAQAADEGQNSQLEYSVYYATSDVLATVSDAETMGTVANAIPTAGISALTISGLTPGTKYYFNVVVSNEAGGKAIYNGTNATTAHLLSIADKTLSVSAVTGTSLTLSWNAASDTGGSALTYKVFRSTSDNISSTTDAEANGTLAGSSTSATSMNLTGLSANTTYYLNVLVSNDRAEKLIFDRITAITTPDSEAPTISNSTLSTSSVGSTSLTLSWNTATDNITSDGSLTYHVYYSIADNLDTVSNTEINGTAANTATSNINSLRLTGLAPGTTYYLNLIVTDGAGNKAPYSSTSALLTTTAFSTFSFQAANNAALSIDVAGYINGTTIRVFPPSGTSLTSLVPTFAVNVATVTVSGATQTSGVSFQDFTDSQTYKVSDGYGTSTDYSVVVAPQVPVPDTGQTSSYPVAAPYGQDSDYSFYSPSYTNNNDGTITDNITGLIWQQSDDSQQYTHSNAITYCINNSGGLPGNGWRLPTVHELSNLTNLGATGPSITTACGGACFTAQSSQYWSITNSIIFDNSAWWVHFNNGGASTSTNNNASAFYVRCVKGRSDERLLKDNGDQTVTDLKNGLVWVQTESPKMEWFGAITYCRELTHAGKNDWRLPTIKELRSLVDYSKKDPALDTTMFPDAPTATSGTLSYWSSTYELPDNSNSYVWNINFYGGSVGNAQRTETYYVRCVR